MPGAKILANVNAIQVLFDEVARLGGEPVMAPTGHPAPAPADGRDVGAPLAGEMSGHIFYADHYYGYDDAVYNAWPGSSASSPCSGESLADMLDARCRMSSTAPELRLPCPGGGQIRRRQRTIHEPHAAGGSAAIAEADGVRVKTDDEQVARALLEHRRPGHRLRQLSTTEEGFARVKAELAAELEASGLALPDV